MINLIRTKLFNLFKGTEKHKMVKGIGVSTKVFTKTISMVQPLFRNNTVLPQPALPPKSQASGKLGGGTFLTSFNSVVTESQKRKNRFQQFENVSLLVPDDSETLDQILIVIARNEICTDPSFFRMLDKLQNRSG